MDYPSDDMQKVSDALRAEGYAVVPARSVTPEFTVTNVERLAADLYGADIDMIVPHFGRVFIRRVTVKLVTSDATPTTERTYWSIRWPRRHKEGTPFGSGVRVTTAGMTGRLESGSRDAIVNAIGGAHLETVSSKRLADQ